jgi:hypothetical protein
VKPCTERNLSRSPNLLGELPEGLRGPLSLPHPIAPPFEQQKLT